jgi:hypothetical protein
VICVCYFGLEVPVLTSPRPMVASKGSEIGFIFSASVSNALAVTSLRLASLKVVASWIVPSESLIDRLDAELYVIDLNSVMSR